MNKDQQLKKDEPVFVILVCGNHKVGKKTFIQNFLKKMNIDPFVIVKSKTYYSYYIYEENEKGIQFHVEIRILNSDENDTDLKMIKPFFQGALGAFIITKLDDYSTFEDGKKWKEKIDLMCCLPNKFPLPIFLMINMCDKVDDNKRSQWIKDLDIEGYFIENQFFNKFFISNEVVDDNIMMKDIINPFTILFHFILDFKDIACIFSETDVNINSIHQTDETRPKSNTKCLIY